MSARELEERFAEVLAVHTTRGESRQVRPAEGPNCGYAVVRVCCCGRWAAEVMRDDTDKAKHRAHVAAELTAVLLSPGSGAAS